MKVRVFDIETDGLLDEVTKMHCLVIKDRPSQEIYRYAKSGFPLAGVVGSIEDGLRMLMLSDLIVGHNIINYDLPVIAKLYPWFEFDESKVVDTLVLVRVLFPNIGDSDTGRIAANKMPSKLWGSQSLEAWGYRLGEMKGEYTADFKARLGDMYVVGMEWQELSQAMLDYNVQDVVVTDKLYDKCLAQSLAEYAQEIEHRTCFATSKTTRTGWMFDEQKAAELYGKLAARRVEILQEMQETFPPLVEERWSEKTGKRLKDKVTEFNPGSRDQIAYRLKVKYGWEPQDFTETGKPKIDEDILGKLDYPEAKLCAEYFMLDKRIGQLAEGDKAWLKLVKKGRIHGSYNSCGAITGRMSHGQPNLGQVPAVRSAYGPECRELFGVPKGYVALGADLSGIELRVLGHYLSRYDGGSYAEAVIKGSQKDGTDVHTLNTKAFGFEFRDSGKTGIYAFLYGCGGLQMFSTAEADAKRAGKTLTTRFNTKGKQKKYGDGIIAQFLSRTPAIKKLREAVDKAAAKGHLIGLDGRKLIVRHKHAALNTLLQGAGAVIAKVWIMEVLDACKARGWVWDEDIVSGDFAILGIIHDEIQFAVRPEIAEEFGRMVVDSAASAGVRLGMRVPVGAEFSIGMNWKDTH